MLIKSELDQMQLPKVYMRNGKECFYDTYREKLIPVTPEEIIRQRVASWLEIKLGVPADCIILEQHLSHYKVDSKDRADIIIHKYVEDGMLTPIAVVECKADTVFLSHKTLEQGFRYADLLGIDYALITNGHDILSYRYDEKSKQYIELVNPPSYIDMTQGNLGEPKVYEVFNRPGLDKLMDPDIQKIYTDDWMIGIATKPNMAAHCINIIEALLDSSKTLSKSEGKQFTIVEDLGVRISSFGNASGYDFVSPYRCFLIKDKQENHQIISFGFNAYGNDQTILCVAIDDFKKSHHALQLLVDRYAHQVLNELHFSHTGRIAVGHSGSGSSKALLDIVAREMPEIFNGRELRLGSIPTDILLTLDHPAVTDLFINLIDYALLRDEYRSSIKHK